MKILLITMEWPPVHGGVGNYYYNLVKNLQGIQVEVFEAGTDSFYKFFWPKWLKLFWQVKKLVKKNRPDLIWVGQVLPVGNAAYLIKKFFKIPYFVSTHGMDIMLPQKSAGKEKVMLKILEQARFATANSQFTKRELLNLQIPEDKIEVIYPCPNVNQVDQLDNLKIGQIENKLNIVGKKILLTVGRLVERKGQGKVIEAMPALLKKFPNLVYLVVGQGPAKDQLKLLVNKLGLENKVIFLVSVGNKELPAYYQLADLFVMPAVDLAGDVEGFGIVYLEASLFGLPIVASKSGGVTEAVIDGQTGLLSEPDNLDDLTAKITELLANPVLGNKLGYNGYLRVKQVFVWKNQAEKLINKIQPAK